MSDAGALAVSFDAGALRLTEQSQQALSLVTGASRCASVGICGFVAGVDLGFWDAFAFSPLTCRLEAACLDLLNAGTSVNQIERFYAKRLPISKELMENLQSFSR